MSSKSNQLKTLGAVSAKLIDELVKKNKFIFSLDDIANTSGKTRSQLIDLLRYLAKREVIFRIKPGTYLILKMGEENTQINNWPIIARELAGEHDYYISHLSAMQLHGMTTHPLFDIYITMPIVKRYKQKKIGNMTYHFIYSNPKHFWGNSTHWANREEKVQLSDLERTILDALDRPELCGGIKDIAKGIWLLRKKIDWDNMLYYIFKFKSKAAAKRLGFIMENFELNPDFTTTLYRKLAQAKDYVLLDSSSVDEGNYINRWHVRVNINPEELKASIWT